MDNQTINRETSLSDLGIIVDEKLKWNEHVANINKKAKQRLGLVKRTLGHNIKPEVKLQCYKSLIQPVLEYCTPLWTNTARKNIEKVETVQRKATKYITNDYDNEYRVMIMTMSME